VEKLVAFQAERARESKRRTGKRRIGKWGGERGKKGRGWGGERGKKGRGSGKVVVEVVIDVVVVGGW